MNRLNSYKKLRFSEDDANMAREELNKVLQEYEQALKEKITELVLQSYHNSLFEIERRKLIERAKKTPPKIDFYLKSILYYSLNKLHKGDRIKAYELLEELKDDLIKV